jgi:small subunit ribosomal protein S8
MANNALSQRLTDIRNALLVKHFGLEIQHTRITYHFSKVLVEENLIDSVHKSSFHDNKLFIRLKYHGTSNTPVITNLKLISRPSLRVYTSYKEIPKFTCGFTRVILSTPLGLITDQNASRLKLGGEVLCSIWLTLMKVRSSVKKNL